MKNAPVNSVWEILKASQQKLIAALGANLVKGLREGTQRVTPELNVKLQGIIPGHDYIKLDQAYLEECRVWLLEHSDLLLQMEKERAEIAQTMITLARSGLPCWNALYPVLELDYDYYLKNMEDVRERSAYHPLVVLTKGGKKVASFSGGGKSKMIPWLNSGDIDNLECEVLSQGISGEGDDDGED
jgi:hypothetical protein